MHWNYRIVNVPSENDGYDWFELKEVYYNEDNSLLGYADACIGSETTEGVVQLTEWWAHAATKPPLHEDDFKNSTVRPEPNEEE